MYLQLGWARVDGIHYTFLFGGVIVVAVVCAAAYKTSMNIRRAKASKLADDLDMELLASDNPHTLIVAGEINDRPSTIRYQHERTSLEQVRSGGANKSSSAQEDLLISVQCECEIEFKISKLAPPQQAGTDLISVALLSSNGLSLESKQKEKAAFIFEEPETVRNLIELFERSGACNLTVGENKVSVLIIDADDTGKSPAKVAAILESLDKFARLLEFVAGEHHAIDN